MLVGEPIAISTEMLNLSGAVIQLEVKGVTDTDKRLILSGTVDVVLTKQLAREYKRKFAFIHSST